MSHANADRPDAPRPRGSDPLAAVERVPEPVLEVSTVTAGRRDPAVRPPPPGPAGPLRAGLALFRLPLDLVVALEYLLQQLPHLVHDVRRLASILTRLSRDADPGALARAIDGLAAAVDPRDGSLIRALDAVAELARLQAREIDRRPSVPAGSGSDPDSNGRGVPGG
jgi:hypothetical protein